MKTYDEKDETRERAAVAIIGDPGAGKSLLSASAPGAFMIDAEGRGGHLGIPRVVPRQDEGAFDEMKNFIAELKQSKLDKNGMLQWGKYKIGTLILDTIDHSQALVKLRHKKVYNKQRMYGMLLDDMMNDIMWPMFGLPVNLIFIAHTKTYLNDADEEKKDNDPNKTFPRVDLALEGDLRNKFARFFDNILHLVVKQKGDKTIITSPGVIDSRFLVAKDTLYLFEGKQIPLTFKDGKLESTAMKTIFSTIITNSAEKKKEAENEAKVIQAKTSLFEAAVEKHIMIDIRDAGGAEKLKAALGETYSKMTAETADAALAAGLQVIEAWKFAE